MKRSPRINLPTKDFLAIAKRDEWQCGICGDGYKSGDRWEIDHIQPLVEGGTNHLNNLQLAHRGCNRDSGTKTVLIKH